MKESTELEIKLCSLLLTHQDSNLERQNQNLLCYHYTIVQSVARKQRQRYGKKIKLQKIQR